MALFMAKTELLLNRTVSIEGINRETAPFVSKNAQSGAEKPISTLTGSFFGFRGLRRASYNLEVEQFFA